MSRIHEALKQVSVPETNYPKLVSSGGSEAVEEGPALDEYVSESREPSVASPAAPDVPPQRPVEPSVRVVPARAVESRRQFRYDEGLAGKLVVSDSVPPGSVLEYRRLAHALHDLQVERGLKTLLITSALAGDGRTLTLSNLALTFTESFGRRVLIVDADQRRPSIHAVFGLPNTYGLHEALRSPLRDVPLVQVSECLSVLPAGTLDLAADAVPMDAMRRLLAQLAGQFDWVLLDAAPVAFMSDPRQFARIAGAVLFVIGAGSTPRPIVAAAIAQLGPDCVIGTVLNRVAPVEGVLCVAR